MPDLTTARLACEGLLTRPEGIVSVLELVDRVGVCHSNWKGREFVDYPVGECVCNFFLGVIFSTGIFSYLFGGSTEENLN
ncbi:hypothetical protein BpHYR1_049735 [Brachionus plicatilis]|uniref:Uncharacterized protein n=1 Tax=Brachionus plicatilis TaxID=10195 RepID=A0A3M7QS51_BRAPC|nr:hypothetical protein BpHYR1_049735 [Brachionus plicatilis]